MKESDKKALVTGLAMHARGREALREAAARAGATPGRGGGGGSSGVEGGREEGEGYKCRGGLRGVKKKGCNNRCLSCSSLSWVVVQRVWALPNVPV